MPEFIIVADNLSLDFLNTQIVEDGKPKDLLNSFQDFIAWQTAAGLLKPSEAEKLLKRWKAEEMEKYVAEMLAFRKSLRKTIESIAQGKTVKPTAIKKINSFLHQQYGYHELVHTKEGFQKKFRTDFKGPRQLLFPIAESAADLLSDGNPVYIKKCEGPTCILYFYDTTKNHRRRWCSMAACGNRAKAAAFYQRRRSKNK